MRVIVSSERRGHAQESIHRPAGDRETEGAPAGAVTKGERLLDGFDDRILLPYARGMTGREIRGHLEGYYGVAVSSDLMSRVTDAMLGQVRERQNRSLDPVCPAVFLDALRVKICDEGLAVRGRRGSKGQSRIGSSK